MQKLNEARPLFRYPPPHFAKISLEQNQPNEPPF
jgi:hypothetical protein